MKNRTKTGMGILCLALSAALFSCKKEPVTTDEFAYSKDAAGNDLLNNVNETADASAQIIGPDATSYDRKNLLFNYTAESASTFTTFAYNSTSYWAYNQSCCSQSVKQSSIAARSGLYSMRFELNKTDADVFGSKRAEMSRYSKGETNPYVERWYGMSIYLPSDYATDPAPEILTQWQAYTAHPPLAIWTQKGEWRIVQFGKTITSIGAYERNKWTDFVVHVKWSAGADGLVEIWKNGVKIYTRNGPSIASGLTTGVYMRTGIYKWPWKTWTTSTTTKRVAYIDDVRIGNAAATYNDVVPGL